MQAEALQRGVGGEQGHLQGALGGGVEEVQAGALHRGGGEEQRCLQIVLGGGGEEVQAKTNRFKPGHSTGVVGRSRGASKVL